MAEEHGNVSLLKRLDLGNIAAAADLFAADVVFHFFNPLLPDVDGDYVGRAGLQAFFEKLAKKTEGTFKVHPVSVTAVGDELLVSQTKNTLTVEGRKIETDVVVVWRIVDGRIAEVWDIPSVHSARISEA